MDQKSYDRFMRKLDLFVFAPAALIFSIDYFFSDAPLAWMMAVLFAAVFFWLIWRQRSGGKQMSESDHGGT